MAKYDTEALAALKAKGHTFPGGDGTGYPIDDDEDLGNAVRAAGAGNADHTAIRRYITRRADQMGLADRIPDTWNPDGTTTGGRADTPDDPDYPTGGAAVEEMLAAGGPCERVFPLDDISIRADGTGRTVIAYCAVFDRAAEINDQDGHYSETLDRAAFTKTLAERSDRVGCFYNHAKTLYGTPSDRGAVPLGRPEEIRADGTGVLTVTRYNHTPLADDVLEAIRNGDITGQSFSGRFIASRRTRGRSGGIDAIHRLEVALREYGPTPIPAYAEAGIVGVRAAHLPELADTLRNLDPDQRADLQTLLDTARTVGPPPPTPDAATGTTEAPPAPAIHAGPTPAERRLRLLDLKGIRT